MGRSRLCLSLPLPGRWRTAGSCCGILLRHPAPDRSLLCKKKGLSVVWEDVGGCGRRCQEVGCGLWDVGEHGATLQHTITLGIRRTRTRADAQTGAQRRAPRFLQNPSQQHTSSPRMPCWSMASAWAGCQLPTRGCMLCRRPASTEPQQAGQRTSWQTGEKSTEFPACLPSAHTSRILERPSWRPCIFTLVLIEGGD